MRLDEVLDLDENPVIMLSGVQNSGKSFLMKQFIAHNAWRYHEIIVLSGTEFNKSLIEGVSHPRIKLIGFSHFNPETRKIEERGEELLEAIVGNLHYLKSNSIQWSCLLVLEDWIGSIQPNSKALSMLARASRHYGLTMLIAVQKLKSMTSTFLRSACKYMLVFGTLPKQEMDGICDYITEPYYSQNPSAFVHDIRKTLSERYEFCLIDRITNTVKFYHPIQNELECFEKRRPTLGSRIGANFLQGR